MLIPPPIHSDGAKGIALAKNSGFEICPFNKSGDFNGHKWYRTLGKGLARQRQDAILCGLPRGYALGRRARSSQRNDKYIFGHPSQKPYRSAKEFIPHLQWLNRKTKSTKCAKCRCHLCDNSSSSSRSDSASSSTDRRERLPTLKGKTGDTKKRRQTSTLSALSIISTNSSCSCSSSSTTTTTTTTTTRKKRTPSSMTSMEENNDNRTSEEEEEPPRKKRQDCGRKKAVKRSTSIKAGQQVRKMAYVYIEAPPDPQDLPIPDYIDIPDLVLPSNHCLL